MGEANLRVEGLNRLRRTMKKAGDDITGDFKVAHLAAAEIVKRSSAPWAPHRTGRLAGSVTAAGQASAAIVRAGRVPYGAPIHWGWKKRHIAGRPWLWIAAQKSRDQWEDAYQKQVEKIIDRIEGTPGP